ncbi:MAG: YggS family pyridoxal phosphate-dependent enzyme [Desulfobacteraceae bacterium]|nr:YggS family pyridoxal phosphate-dependent enzyme [Desulfobacteraceae bacterium]
MNPIAENIRRVQEKISNAALSCGRAAESVKLVAVTKTVEPEKIRNAVEAGLNCFGENYIQEARQKAGALADCDISWHFIGHLQSNKAKYAVPIFDLIHSVDTFKLAREINRQAEKRGLVQKILIQVNLGEEESKSGVQENEVLGLAGQISELENLSIQGLMTMPPFFDQPEKVRPFFRRLALLREKLAGQQIPGVVPNELSMGMTGDFEVAIEESATLVRIGTALFGERA